MKNTNSSKKDFKGLESRRLSAAKLFKLGISQSEIAQRMGVSRQAVHVWHNKYRKKGRAALLSKKATGRPAKLSSIVIKKQLPKILNQGATAYGFSANVWTTVNIGSVIQKEFQVSYHCDHIRKILHQIGFSWQKPEKRAIERNERRIIYWKNKTWPDIKKKRWDKARN